MVKLLGPEILDLKYYFWTEREDRRRAGRRDAHRLDLRGRLRGLPHRHDQGHGGLRGDHGGRRSRSASSRPARATSAGSRARIFNWGADMTYENNPFELGLDRLVDLDLPRRRVHLDRGAARRSRTRASTRRINGVELDGDPFPALNNVKWPALDRRGGQVGKVTSAIYSPRLAKNIGYCWLPAERSTEGRR